MSPDRRRARAVSLALAAGGAATGIALQRRHTRAVAQDPEYAVLRDALPGQRLPVVSADGTHIHAQSFGPEEAPTVVLAHGWTEDLHIWGPVIRDLLDHGLRAVAYDLRGHGGSDPAVNRDYSLDRFGDDVEAVLAAAAPSGGAVMVGHSLGAMSIAAWADGHDVAVRASAAALVSTGLGDLLSGHLLFGEVAKRFNSRVVGRMVLGSRAPIPALSSPVSHSMIRHIAFGPSATLGQVAFYERMLVNTPADVRAAAGVAISDMDLHHAVQRLTVPTLVIAGDRDRLTPPNHARRIAEALPHPAGLIILDQTGHMSPLERPAEVAEAIRGLVKQTS